jgi:hypothetical protein
MWTLSKELNRELVTELELDEFYILEKEDRKYDSTLTVNLRMC